jgi:hypothetical protein
LSLSESVTAPRQALRIVAPDLHRVLATAQPFLPHLFDRPAGLASHAMLCCQTAQGTLQRCTCHFAPPSSSECGMAAAQVDNIRLEPRRVKPMVCEPVAECL